MPRTIGLVLYPDFQILDACGPITSFEIAGRMAGDAYRLTLISATGGPVRSSAGVELATIAPEQADTIDTLIVVGGNGVTGMDIGHTWHVTLDALGMGGHWRRQY